MMSKEISWVRRKGFRAWLDDSISFEAEAKRWENARRSFQVPSGALYGSAHLTALWKQVAALYSPLQKFPEVKALYKDAALQSSKVGLADHIEVIALGCGGSDKDIWVLEAAGIDRVTFTPIDVSAPLLMESVHKAQDFQIMQCNPIVANLGERCPSENNWLVALPQNQSARRWITSFGLLPNLSPDVLMSHACASSRSGDLWLLSANLRQDNDTDLQNVLSDYDNLATRAWIHGGLIEWNLSPYSVSDFDKIIFKPAVGERGWIKVSATWENAREELWEVFFSFRPTQAEVHKWLEEHKWKVLNHWHHNKTGEGIWLAIRE